MTRAEYAAPNNQLPLRALARPCPSGHAFGTPVTLNVICNRENGY